MHWKFNYKLTEIRNNRISALWCRAFLGNPILDMEPPNNGLYPLRLVDCAHWIAFFRNAMWCDICSNSFKMR